MDHNATRDLISLLQQGPQNVAFLCQELKLSSQSFHKFITHLHDLGLEVATDVDASLTLTKEISLIDEDILNRHLLQNNYVKAHKLYLLLSVDSTNAYLKQQPFSVDVTQVCLAEHQSAGRGRRGKQWVSPIACNIYLSIAHRCAIASSHC